MTVIKIQNLNITNKKILIRADLNVPMNGTKITSKARIKAAFKTIKYALQKRAKVYVMSHLGRPKINDNKEKYSLFPIFKYIQKKITKHKVYFIKQYSEILNIKSGELAILENVRFNKGELENDTVLSKKYAELCDIFVMDAFGTAHRKQASTYGVSCFSYIACAGFLLQSEIKYLEKVLIKPKKPMIAILGGSKISTKFNVLNAICKIADTVIVGGGIANTFLAIDNNVGKSLHEPKFIIKAKKLQEKYNIITPIDSRVGVKFKKTEQAIIKNINDIQDNEEIMDFGDKTLKIIEPIIKKAQTILWNGPVGVFEFPNFSIGTKFIAQKIANSDSLSIAGGGDTIAVIDKYKIKKNISYISTGGGAFLKFIEGNKMPGIKILKERFKNI
ncbi:phosphoglycerate kinase [Buchnera aphidicola (Mollitrichosiphum nigrofasciatum)]|uniref:phosphoglycerate kinase n=1 Tax=Buchnera aphidicola TaxID=9 RepID=UPI0031B812A5